jgi:hypothetical protein
VRLQFLFPQIAGFLAAELAELFVQGADQLLDRVPAPGAVAGEQG